MVDRLTPLILVDRATCVVVDDKGGKLSDFLVVLVPCVILGELDGIGGCDKCSSCESHCYFSFVCVYYY